MQKYKILWADDEIDLLKPHIIFLNERGYNITTVYSGIDAIEQCTINNFDIVFLDENMPGLTGLETLTKIKSLKPNLPIVMITKSEEEHIMEEAIGAKIADYLIKPLNPNQILLSIKKILDNKRLISEKTNINYQHDFTNISTAFNEITNFEQWSDIYKKLIYWELEIDNTEEKSMAEVIYLQKEDANKNFSRFVINNYESWLNKPDPVHSGQNPLMSHQLMRQKIFPLLNNEDPIFFILIDNLRYDQWKILESIFSEYFIIEKEGTYCSILPTTTAYARNAIFSGLLPFELSKKHPDLWLDDQDEGGKNLNEKELLTRQLQNMKMEDIRFSYNKITNLNRGKELVDNINNLMTFQLNVIVYNFVDMLSHARTDMEMIRELAPDESAYRSITKSWFLHSPLIDALKKISEKKAKVVITTDHGSIRVKKPFKIVGDRNTNTNLRYKQGKNLNYHPKNVLVAKHPERFHLPQRHFSTTYVFATEDQFFVYPNNYNYFVNYYKDTFQHGGISMEEMIIPLVFLSSKVSA